MKCYWRSCVSSLLERLLPIEAANKLTAISATEPAATSTKELLAQGRLTAVKHGPCSLTEKKKGIQAFETKYMGKLLGISYLEHRTNDWVQRRTASLWVHRNLFWQLSRDGNLHGSGMSHTMTDSPEPSFREPWRVPWSAEEMLDG